MNRIAYLHDPALHRDRGRKRPHDAEEPVAWHVLLLPRRRHDAGQREAHHAEDPVLAVQPQGDDAHPRVKRKKVPHPHFVVELNDEDDGGHHDGERQHVPAAVDDLRSRVAQEVVDPVRHQRVRVTEAHRKDHQHRVDRALPVREIRAHATQPAIGRDVATAVGRKRMAAPHEPQHHRNERQGHRDSSGDFLRRRRRVDQDTHGW